MHLSIKNLKDNWCSDANFKFFFKYFVSSCLHFELFQKVLEIQTTFISMAGLQSECDIDFIPSNQINPCQNGSIHMCTYPVYDDV